MLESWLQVLKVIVVGGCVCYYVSLMLGLGGVDTTFMVGQLRHKEAPRDDEI